MQIPFKNELLARGNNYFNKSVDPACLTYFRICFGLLISWQAWIIINGTPTSDPPWIWTFLSEKTMYFKYWPFDFVHALPANFLFILTYILVVCGFMVAIGLFYRVSASVIFLIFTYIFLIEKARYEHHLYLICLLSFLMIFVPAGKNFTIATLIGPNPRVVENISNWAIWLFRIQMGLVYFFAGIAKLHYDWLLRAEPVSMWISDYSGVPFLEHLSNIPATPYAMSYIGLILDVLAFPLLCHYRSRAFTYFILIIFHLLNSHLFGVGIFPSIMILTTAIFFDNTWPKQLVNDIKQFNYPRLLLVLFGATFGFVLGHLLYVPQEHPVQIAGAIGMGIFFYHIDEPFKSKVKTAKHQISCSGQDEFAKTSSRKTNLITGLILLWIISQLIIPIRHIFIPGNVNWTNEGHYFTWRVKLNIKEADAIFTIHDKQKNEQWQLDPHVFLTEWQYETMITRPDLIIQFVKFVETYLNENGYPDIGITANIKMSLNGNHPQLLLDPNKDLTKVSYPWVGHASWILNPTQ